MELFYLGMRLCIIHRLVEKASVSAYPVVSFSVDCFCVSNRDALLWNNSLSFHVWRMQTSLFIVTATCLQMKYYVSGTLWNQWCTLPLNASLLQFVIYLHNKPDVHLTPKWPHSQYSSRFNSLSFVYWCIHEEVH